MGLTIRDIIMTRLFVTADGMMMEVPVGLRWLAEAIAEDLDWAAPVFRNGKWIVLGCSEARECVDRLPECAAIGFPKQISDALATASTLGKMKPLSKEEFDMLCRWVPIGTWTQQIPVEIS